ncbi:MAG: hypothetical protein ACYDBH_21805 [Acidobacteriaceae bacterium]
MSGNISSRVVDWQLLALKLRRHAPLEHISKEIGRHPSWLSHIARGEVTEPKFSDGIKLLDYASDHLPAEELKQCR